MNYYQFHIGDYAAHTRHLSLLEDLAYRRILDLYYLSEGPVEGRPEQIARMIGMRDHVEEVRQVLIDFFDEQDAAGENPASLWASRRCDQEIAKFRSMAEGGKRGAAKRWASPPQCPPDSPPIDTPSTPQCKPITNNQEPRTSNQEPVTIKEKAAKRRQQIPDDFVPNEAGRNAATQKGISLSDELEKFRNYHLAKGSVMLDWQAAWRTWVGNARPAQGRTKQLDPSWAALYSRSTIDADAKVIE